MPHPTCEAVALHLPRDLAPSSMLEHEWRTPLTVIRSAAEVLRDQQDLTPRERNLLLDALIAEAARLQICLEAHLSGAVVDAHRFSGLRRARDGCLGPDATATSDGRRCGP